MVTSKDVAALAGVSHTTVSRVFRNENTVSEKTRNKVLEAANILNYHPDPMASVLKSGISHTVSFLNPYPDNTFYMRHISKISQVLQEKYAYKTLMIPDTHYAEHVADSIKFLLSYHVDGIVFSPIKQSVQQKEEIERLIMGESHCRFLQLHSNVIESVDSISYDDYNTMYQLVNEILDNGHRRILLISDDMYRAAAFIEAHKNRQINDYMIIGQDSPESTSDAIISAIQNYKPAAVIAIAQMFALPALEALTKLKLRTPEDVAFVVYDESPWLKALGITSVSHDEEMTVQHAADRIHGLITGEYTQTEHLVVPSVILYRKSFMPLKNR